MTTSEELPYETLCEIFELLYDEPIALHILQKTSQFGIFPWAAGLVCKRWRAVFLSYPHFWTSFYLRDGPSTFDDKYVAEMNRRMAMYVERSKQLPLSVVVHIHHLPTRNNASPQVQSTWRILLSLSHRWKIIELMVGVPSESFVHDLGTCKGKIPILESLTVSTIRGSTRLPLDAFEIAPRLAEVELNHVDRINFEVLPLSQLKSITMFLNLQNWSGISRIYSILPALRNAEELRFTGFVSNDNLPEIVPVHLDRLRVLQISHPDALSWIEAPSLEHLHVEQCFYDGRDRYGEELLYFVQKSSCRIRQLTLQCCDVSTAFSIMKILTHVNKLTITNCLVAHSSVMIRAIAKFDYMPNLRILEVACLRIGSKEVVDAIRSLLEMWNSESKIIPLEKIVVHLKWTRCKGEYLILDEVNEASWPSFVDVEVVHWSSSRLSVTINIFIARRHRLASSNAVEEA
ncbi:hypothetical protein F5887DRAFT_1214838 [Amanita rubescens]|nr:hypothetical protein F5887DRAFT_1214838 [Amanita rubescens]